MSLTRYHSHYITSAVIPAVIIAALVLSSLWMSAHATRLTMGVTGLLTMTAIQVRSGRREERGEGREETGHRTPVATFAATAGCLVLVCLALCLFLRPVICDLLT